MMLTVYFVINFKILIYDVKGGYLYFIFALVSIDVSSFSISLNAQKTLLGSRKCIREKTGEHSLLWKYVQSSSMCGRHE